ncbi:hypothetical protein Fcan01_07677 [Folsomia candida]|uniref:Nucleolus and neural progenitor protein-like N-terminal domain-containing protein n=2 Tax=Folsomia candida TaxID=158441 RepID=A0A226EIR6_FOLCA|nr:hypothetical protein Fcan01_07677 [Folsomia candida]
MLSNRIHKLGKRWLANKWLHEYTIFDDGVQLSLTKKSSKTKPEKEEGVRLPSRQWANWITYLTLRDCLILAKIKHECERTVKYWLGLISSSHHATDSLVAVGVLSRMWYVSSSMVESLINVMYPTICKLSIHLEPTKAENWLMDLGMPSPEYLSSSWLEEILGSPFIPARLRKGLDTMGTVQDRTRESVLMSGSKSISDNEKRKSTAGNVHAAQSPSSTSPTTVTRRVVTKSESSSDEDVGVPVNLPSTSQQLSKHQKSRSSIVLDERWTRFFSGYKSKLKTEKGRKQFCVRIRKWLQDETTKKVIVKLKRLRNCIKSGNYSEMIVMINQFQKFLSTREISS